MNPEPTRPTSIDLTISATHPQLVQGLELWLQLGLLSDAQVRRICRHSLACTLPTPSVQTDPLVAEPRFITDSERDRPPTPTRSPQRPVPASSPEAVPLGFLGDRLQALMDEISVIWLLVLGVFMVVVSSGVLAASQWQNVPPTGQYLVLLGYTVAFWLASWWTGTQPNLQLTAKMLQATTLLIIPINFWMMDVALWSSAPTGWAIAMLSALGLTWVAATLIMPQAQASARPVLLAANAIALGWLHWGWDWPGVPLIATYIGTIGTTAILVNQTPTRSEPPSPSDPGSPPLSFVILTLGLATLLLIVRAVWVADIPWNQLGLALGICGWLLCWLAERFPGSSPWSPVGIGLLVVGWAVNVSTDVPIQAIAVSGLAIERLWQRLRRSPTATTLMATVLVGLQTYGLLWRLIPPAIRQGILSQAIALAGTREMPYTLIGLGLLPYLWLMLWGVHYWRRKQNLALAEQLEILVYGLGLVLLGISVGNPLVRSLNLTLSTLTLVVLLRLRPTVPKILIYVTHGAGLAAIAAWVDWAIPDLSTQNWAYGLIGVALVEWAIAGWFSPQSTPSEYWTQWQESAWVWGLGFSALSYVLLLGDWSEPNRDWPWLLVPVGLTLLAYRPPFPHSHWAARASTLAILVAQGVTIADPTPRLMGLGLATLLMLLNTRRWLNPITPLITVGFGLATLTDGIWQSIGSQLTSAWISSLWAIAALLLWLAWDRLIKQSSPLVRGYAIAADRWAMLITVINGCALTWSAALTYLDLIPEPSDWLMAIVLMLGAISYRLWRDFHEDGVYALAWGLELFLVVLLSGTDASSESLAIANLGLGAGLVLLGDRWVRRRRTAYRPYLHAIPLGYALMGLLVGHQRFEGFTGLYTLAFGIILVSVARRDSQFKPLIYPGVLTASVAAYELLVYQLLQAPGGNAGDGIVLLAGLGMLIALGDCLVARWLAPYLGLMPSEWRGFITLHWVFSSALLLTACVYPMGSVGQWIWTGVAAGLSLTALIEGRRQEPWIYAGIVTGLMAIANTLYLVIPDHDWLNTWAGAIACPVAIALYLLPWGRWGWAVTPWDQSAIVLPGIVLTATIWAADIPTLLIVAAYYAWLAKQRHQIRLSYISLLLTDWAVMRWLHDAQVNDPIWYALIAGLSLLYVAQVDTVLQTEHERELRHLLRCLAVGLISLTAIYESETHLGIALLTLIYSIGLVLAGLTLRIRAFLFVGTATFMIQVMRQLWLLINTYSLLIWAVGIVVGLLFIWIAATFEARRSQVISFVRYWVGELETWQ